MSFVRLINGESYPAPNGTKQALLELLAEHISKYGDKNLTLSELGKDPRMPEGTKMNIYSTHFGTLSQAIAKAMRKLPSEPLSSTISIPAEVAEKVVAKEEVEQKEQKPEEYTEAEIAAEDFVEYEELDSTTEPEELEQPAVDEPEMELKSITAEPTESEEPKPEFKKRKGGTSEETDELCENFKKLCEQKGYVMGQTEQRKLKKEGANIPSWETLKKYFGPAETWPKLFGLPLGYRLTPERGNRSKEKPAPKKSATRLPKAEPVNSKTAPVEAPKPAVEIGPAIVTTPVAQTTPGTIEVEVTIPVKVKFNFNLEATFSFNTQ